MEKKACILNSVIVILEVVALTWMISGITDGALSISGLRSLRYFTVLKAQLSWSPS